TSAGTARRTRPAPPRKAALAQSTPAPDIPRLPATTRTRPNIPLLLSAGRGGGVGSCLTVSTVATLEAIYRSLTKAAHGRVVSATARFGRRGAFRAERTIVVHPVSCQKADEPELGVLNPKHHRIGLLIRVAPLDAHDPSLRESAQASDR